MQPMGDGEGVENVEGLLRAARAAAREQGAEAWQDEIASEAVARYLLAVEPVRNSTAFVRVVARRLAIDWHRRQPPGGWTSAPDDNDRAQDPLHQLVEPSPSAAVRRAGQVAEVLAVVSPRERDLLMKWANGWTAEELAREFGYASAAAVRTLVTRAKRKILDAFPDAARFDI